MHAFARHLHGSPDTTASAETKGLLLNGGWRYDLGLWFVDATLFRGQLRQLRRRTADLADVRDGDEVLDVGCGTGTLALDIARRVGPSGHVVGIDPSAPQIARARAKASRRHLGVAFQTGVIERLPFPDQTFDAVVATLMLHHLPAPLKRQGLAEIVRVLKPAGRLVLADFAPKTERQGRAARFHAGGSSLQDVVALVTEAGLTDVEMELLPPAHFSVFPGAGFVRARRAQ